jgi:phosphohistidine phosphatase SixA
MEDERLNPSSSFENFIKVKDKIETKFDKIEVIAFVGHEPDFSEIISKLISSSMVGVKLKKPSIVEIEFNENRGELIAFLTPKHLKKLKV